MPDWTDWAFMGLRVVVFLAATYMGANLLVAFILNHYLHKPKRWLVGWQGLLFTGVGFDALVRLWSRAYFIITDVQADVTTWPYWLAGTLMAVGATGTLLTWLTWPTARTVGQGHEKKGMTP